jgi:hypothetical protein
LGVMGVLLPRTMSLVGWLCAWSSRIRCGKGTGGGLVAGWATLSTGALMGTLIGVAGGMVASDSVGTLRDAAGMTRLVGGGVVDWVVP